MKQKIKDWNASEGFFTVSDMGTYYEVFVAHKYKSNSTAQALYEDLGAGLGILYERDGKHCESYNINCSCISPQNKSCAISDYSTQTYDALNAATDGSVHDPRFGLQQLDDKAATVLRPGFCATGEFDETTANLHLGGFLPRRQPAYLAARRTTHDGPQSGSLHGGPQSGSQLAKEKKRVKRARQKAKRRAAAAAASSPSSPSRAPR